MSELATELKSTQQRKAITFALAAVARRMSNSADKASNLSTGESRASDYWRGYRDAAREAARSLTELSTVMTDPVDLLLHAEDRIASELRSLHEGWAVPEGTTTEEWCYAQARTALAEVLAIISDACEVSR